MSNFYEEFVHVAGITVPLLLEGIVTTLEISGLAILISIFLGFVLGYMCMNEHKIISGSARAYIKVFRCTPFMVQVYLAYYGLPTLGIRVSAFWVGVIILSVYTSAYIAVILESGIRSVPGGQFEAAYAMGMPKLMTLRRIILPQTAGIIIPPLTGQFVQTVKESSILSIITVTELTMMTKKAIGITFSPLIVYICAGVFYWIINIVIELIAKRAERSYKQIHT